MSVLPFYFYYADQTETTFDAGTMNVFNEEIVSFKVNHEEGQFPTLDIVIRNPRIGLLNPSRKQWAWLSWQNGGTVVPLFFGRLVGIPANLFKELVTLQFIARRHDYIAQKQAVAETLKVEPFYDPIFLDDKARDEPDSVLEAYSAMWHIDRTSLAITPSDVLVGEDGTVTFTAEDAFYESVGLQIGAPPLVNVRIEASVNWTQRTSGFFTVPTVNIATYTGDTFVGDWPKPGSGIGGGYTVESSFVTDVFHVAQTPTTNYQSSWEASDNPGQCGNQSASSQSSGPALLSPNPLSCVLTEYVKSGLCFPDSDPPQNTPAETSITGMIVPLWYISADMTVRYDASRTFTELLSFDLIGNVQPLLADPGVDQNTELISIQSIDIGKPLINVFAWTDFAGAAVPIATIIWPNDPTVPGGLAYQVAVQAGTAGATEPNFSDIAGEVTIDGTVHWASLGDSVPSDIPQWSPAMDVGVGSFVLAREYTFNVNTGNLETVPNSGSYYLCIKAGRTNSNFTVVTYTPPVITNDEVTPIPRTVSIITPPAYGTGPGQQISDGTVIWLVLGTNPPSLQIPVGGQATNVTARSYFPTARGIQSVEYLIMRARARLRFRARAVEIEWDSPFALVTGLTCRKNATIEDNRLPGGAATGKIIAYSLECNGSQGELKGHVKIGCSVGEAGSVAAVDGTPEYASAGYMQKGYQFYDGSTQLSDSSDLTFSAPAFRAFDDGLRFPLTWAQISDGGRFSNTLAAQADAIIASFKVAQQLQYIQAWAGKTISTGNTTSKSSGLTPGEAWQLEEQQLALAASNTPYVMEANPIVWTALLKPCSGNGPFIGSYAISVSKLECPKGIDLSAPSDL